MRIGVHVSIAGGIDRAPARAHALQCESMQVFTKSNRQWATQRITSRQYSSFRNQCTRYAITPSIGHACYLLNIASPDTGLFQRSLKTLSIEIKRAARLGLTCIVLHPGAHVGTGVTAGLDRAASGLRSVLDLDAQNDNTNIALETTAGSGTSLGSSFEQLACLIDLAEGHPRLGVCLDTTHIFAAGYDIRTRKAYNETMKRFDSIVGFDRLSAIHLNDSATEIASRVDRHAHIGHGKIGSKAFRFFLTDDRLKHLPAVLETPKEMNNETHWDVLNLITLRRLRKGSS